MTMTVENNWKISSDPHEHKLEPAKGLILNANDVLCGRGKISYNHAGNRRFRDLITSNLEDYNNAVSRFEKSLVVDSIVREIKSAGGRFLKQDSRGKWTEHDNKRAKEKVGHAIRDAASLTENKVQKRKHRKQLATFASDGCYGSDGGDNKLLHSRRTSWSSSADILLPHDMGDFRIEDDSLLHNNTVNDDDDCEFLAKIHDTLGPLPSDGELQDPLRRSWQTKRGVEYLLSPDENSLRKTSSSFL